MRITTYEKGGNSLNPFIKLLIFLMIILSLFVMPVSAQVVNGGFTSNDFTGWSLSGVDDYYVPTASGGYANIVNDKGHSSWTTMYQTVNVTSYDYLEFRYRGTGSNWDGDVIYVNIGGEVLYLDELNTTWSTYQINVSELTNNVTLTCAVGSRHNWLAYGYFDDIFLYTGDVNDTYDISIIQWGALSYYSDEIATILYFIHDDDWLDTSLGYGYTFYLNYKDSGDNEYIKTRLTSESGSKEIQFDESDSYYTAYLSKHWADKSDSFLFPEIVLDTESVNIYQRDRVGTLSLNTTSTTTGSSFNITYRYEYTPTAPSITVKRLIDGVWSDDTLGWIGLTNYDTMVEYTIQHSIDQEGKYLIELRDGATVLRTRVIEIVFIGLPPEQNITTSFISTDKELYLFGSTIFTNFAIDNVNYSNTAVFMDIYNNDKGILSYHLPVYSQIDTHYIHLTGNKNIDTNWGFFIIQPPKFHSGENIIRLSKYDIISGDYISDIVSKLITIDIVTTDGYGLTLSEYEIMEGESIIINYIVPSASTLKIIRTSTQEIIKTMKVNTSDSFKYTFTDFGIYDIELHSTNYLEITTQIIVSDIDISIDPTIPDTTFQDNTTSLLNSPYLIGLLIMAVFLAVGAASGIGGMIVTGSIGLGMVCYMGIFPWILLVIEVLVVAALMAKGMINLAGD